MKRTSIEPVLHVAVDAPLLHQVAHHIDVPALAGQVQRGAAQQAARLVDEGRAAPPSLPRERRGLLALPLDVNQTAHLHEVSGLGGYGERLHQSGGERGGEGASPRPHPLLSSPQ